jgi:hypothetical protein
MCDVLLGIRGVDLGGEEEEGAEKEEISLIECSLEGSAECSLRGSVECSLEGSVGFSLEEDSPEEAVVITISSAFRTEESFSYAYIQFNILTCVYIFN